ncbi:MAG TPA: putative sporulation protein YtxC [Bacillota bacterium]
MAKVITISASEPAAELERALQKGMADLRRDCGVAVDVEVDRAADPAVLRCRFEAVDRGAALRFDRCRERLAHVLAGFVIDHMEPALLKRLLQQGYAGLRQDGETILAVARRQLAGAEQGPLPPPESRRLYLQQHILRYLEESDERLHIDGLLTFRMGDYLEELEAVLDRAVEDVLIEREFREFVALLRCFVEVQEPRLDLVHVLIGGDGRFTLMDGDGRRVAHDESPPVDDESLYDSLKADGGDLLISALVAVAPRRVLLHDPGGLCTDDVTGTLRGVFPQRVHLCRGCRLCRRGAGRRDGW